MLRQTLREYFLISGIHQGNSWAQEAGVCVYCGTAGIFGHNYSAYASASGLGRFKTNLRLHGCIHDCVKIGCSNSSYLGGKLVNG